MRLITTRLMFCGLILLTSTHAVSGQATQTELSGPIVEVSGTTVTIELTSGPLPNVGDSVAIHEEIPGVGSVAIRGTWEVTDVGLEFAIATADDEALKPQTGQQATISVAAPRTRQQVALDVSLLEAADGGNVADAQQALRAGANANVRGQMGSTPLMRAATAGHVDVMREILTAGGDPALEARGGQSALGVAAAQGHVGALVILLEAGADLEARISSPRASESMRGSTALTLAARFGHVDAARRLLQAGADHAARTAQGDNALTLAAGSEDGELVALLLEAGADPNAGRPDGGTPLLIAADANGNRAARLLIEAGADLEARVANSAPEPFAGMTALLLASHAGNTETVVTLLAAGADSNAVNTNGQTALTLARQRDHDQTVAALRDPALAIETASRGASEALRSAAENGEVDEVRELLEAGASVDARDQDYGATALILAASENRIEVVELLLQHGADIDAQAVGAEDGEAKGFSGLMLAAMFGHEEMVTLLLQAGANTRLREGQGETAADLARSEGHEAIASLLESSG